MHLLSEPETIKDHGLCPKRSPQQQLYSLEDFEEVRLHLCVSYTATRTVSMIARISRRKFGMNWGVDVSPPPWQCCALKVAVFFVYTERISLLSL